MREECVTQGLCVLSGAGLTLGCTWVVVLCQAAA